MRGSLASVRMSSLSSWVSLEASNWSSCLLTDTASITVLKTGKPFFTLSAAS